MLVKFPTISLYKNNFIPSPALFFFLRADKMAVIFVDFLQDANASKQEKAMNNYGEIWK